MSRKPSHIGTLKYLTRDPESMSPLVRELVLPLDAFIRSVEVNKRSFHSFFLGAGASVSSGVPSASRCIWEWKRRIFLTNNLGLDQQFSDVSVPSVQQRIQNWLDADGCYPTAGSTEAYGFYIKVCYPLEEDQRRYFQQFVERASPYLGYQLLCLFAEAEIVRAVWSTNFDGLAARAATAARITPIEVGLDNTGRTVRPPAPERAVPRWEQRGAIARQNYKIEKIEIQSEPGITIPALVFVPSGGPRRKPAVLYLDAAA